MYKCMSAVPVHPWFLHIVSACFVYIRYQIGDFSGEVLNEVTVPLAEKTSYPAPTSLPMSSRHKAESKIKVNASSRREKICVREMSRMCSVIIIKPFLLSLSFSHTNLGPNTSTPSQSSLSLTLTLCVLIRSTTRGPNLIHFGSLVGQSDSKPSSRQTLNSTTSTALERRITHWSVYNQCFVTHAHI